MGSPVASPPKKAGKTKLTLQAVYRELRRLRGRVEDLEDLRELNEAIARNQGRKLVPWDQAKKELGLED